MNILAAQKTIGLHVPGLKNITLFKINVSIDKSIHADGNTVSVNPNKLDGKKKRQLKQLLRTEILDEAGAIVDERSSETVSEVIEVLPEIEATARQYIVIIPPADIPLLKACLFLRKRYQAGNPVDDLKNQIARSYGPRGRNLSNLCSAGYLEDWFWPLYENLLRDYPDDPNLAKLKFQAIYSMILNELPFTEFVSTGWSADKTLRHIVEKINRNRKSGIRFLNIHGLGRNNVTKVCKILPEIKEQTGAMPSREEKDSNRIFVRLEVM